ncbi:MAG: hypothetical protein NVS9B4_00150 [Candidatus Acidiferrum sp.]
MEEKGGRMSVAEQLVERGQESPSVAAAGKRIVFTMGGKGGVGKSRLSVGLAEWYATKGVAYTMLDLDSENKTLGSLHHFFEDAEKVNINTPDSLDVMMNRLENTDVILADMGAGAGDVTYSWFDAMYQEAAGVKFTAIGVITPDPASVVSVLEWASRLKERVQYLIVENSVEPYSDFRYWHDTEFAERFRARFQPIVIATEYRVPTLEKAAGQYGLTLGRVARRETDASELRTISVVMRAQGYRRRMLAEFDKAEELLLP